jgi:hypothetical protein
MFPKSTLFQNSMITYFCYNHNFISFCFHFGSSWDKKIKLFDAIRMDMGVNINYFFDDEDPIPSISKYIETMCIFL